MNTAPDQANTSPANDNPSPESRTRKIATNSAKVALGGIAAVALGAGVGVGTLANKGLDTYHATQAHEAAQRAQMEQIIKPEAVK